MGCLSKTKISNKPSTDINSVTSNRINNVRNNLEKSNNQENLFVSSISMMNESSGWIVQGKRVLRTINGGVSWSDVTPYNKDANKLYNEEPDIAAAFYDCNIAWISVGAYSKDRNLAVYHTADGGKHWDKSNVPVVEDWEYFGQHMSFIDSNNGFMLVNSSPACGIMYKAIYKTNDGGRNWSRIGNISAEIDSYPTGMVFRNSREGWITCSNHGQDYILTFKTDDGGHSWHKENLQLISDYKDYYTNSYPPVVLDNAKNSIILPIEYVNGESRFIIPYLSSDGGHSWNALKNLSNHTFSCFDFINEKKWMAIDKKDNTLYETNNYGNSWIEVYQNEIFKGINTLDFVTEQIGWAAGHNIFIMTKDGGKTWNYVKQFYN